jgi:teichuronic acid biosynthesis glycosyltransferase TuaC
VRIAIVTTSYPRSEDDPSGHFVRAGARQLEREGHVITLVAPRRVGGAFGWPGVAARLRERPLRVIDAAAWVARSRARLAQLDVDRVVAHWALPCAWPIGVASGAPLEVVSHGGDVRLLSTLPSAARSRLVGTIAARASEWRFVSHALLNDLLESVDHRARSHLERVADVRPMPIEIPDVRAAIDRRRSELGGARVAVSVGRLVPGKRVDRAVEYVAGVRGLDTLVIVGDGPGRARLERLARRHGIDARFVGAVGRRDALAWIGAADVLLHASQAEGLSTVIREAEALGTSVLRLPGLALEGGDVPVVLEARKRILRP